MTIVASVKVRDGLILGTDSMTQISVATDTGPQILKGYSNARKLFQLEPRPVGVMTYGLGNVQNRSIEGLVLDFAGMPEADVDSVETLSQNLFAHVNNVYSATFDEVEPEQRPGLGFYVAGYSADAPFPEEFEFMLPRDEGPVAARGSEEFGASWRGVDAPFTRLYKGFDPYVVPPRLTEAGLDDEAISRVLHPDQLETAVVFDGMPVQDAINFAAFILEATIGWSTFAVGYPLCGGPLQVAVILPDTGFTWVARPEPHVRSFQSIGGS